MMKHDLKTQQDTIKMSQATVERFVSGDQKAFQQIFYWAYPKVFSFVLSLAKDADDAEDISNSDRKVCLAGEAFFDVVKDAERPFFVDINQLQLKVLGTTFDVSGYPEDPEMTTTLKTGKVEVCVNHTDKCYVLNPGN